MRYEVLVRVEVDAHNEDDARTQVLAALDHVGDCFVEHVDGPLLEDE